jgi:hypothetical protein
VSNQDHTELTSLIERLSAEQARQVTRYVQTLLDKQELIDESDAWTEEDMRDITQGAMDYANEKYPYEWEEASLPQPPKP